MNIEMAEILFREMHRKDLPILLMISQENMASIILSSWGVELRDEEILRAILGPDAYSEVIEIDDEIVGYFSIDILDGKAFINAIQVKKGHQGEGYGTAMMERIYVLALSSRAKTIDLWVQLTNHSAMKFYRYCGYRTISRQGNNYLMRKDLPNHDAE